MQEIIKLMHPRLDEKALAIRVALAEEMEKDGWELVVSSGVFTIHLLTPKLRFFDGPYVAESRYKLTPVPGGTEEDGGKWSP